MGNGQTSLEYIMVLAGAAALILILVVFVSNTLSTGYGQTNNNWFGFLQNTVPSNGIGISDPTQSSPMTIKAGSGSFNVTLALGNSVTAYDLTVSGNEGTLCSFSRVPVNNTGNSNTSVKVACAYNNAVAGKSYDITANSYVGQTQTGTTTQAGAVKPQ